MLSERIPIRFNNFSEDSNSIYVTLCELTGKDEMSVNGIDTASSVELLDRIIKKPVDCLPVKVNDMGASDRDGLLAALHRQHWGDKIVSSLSCQECGEEFDLSFQLSELEAHIRKDIKDWKVNGNNFAISNTGSTVKLPTAEQEIEYGLSNNGDPLVELANVLDIDTQYVELACKNMEHAAPIIDLELDAQCPECKTKQQVHFDIQSFVLKRLLNEREGLLTEIHFLATNYKWSLSEILDISRSMRKTLTLMLDS